MSKLRENSGSKAIKINQHSRVYGFYAQSNNTLKSFNRLTLWQRHDTAQRMNIKWLELLSYFWRTCVCCRMSIKNLNSHQMIVCLRLERLLGRCSDLQKCIRTSGKHNWIHRMIFKKTIFFILPMSISETMTDGVNVNVNGLTTWIIAKIWK